ncbi:helix-turn-helix domain-containing protein [Brachybacterium paraconglomeratum]|uniref:helix-turn-helix domain-containing protein n=1 Tax=Brachybacterium paraconglomeratum TaxID=173362 RepID=UPI003F7B699B
MAGYHIEREMQELGQRVRGWRMVLGLTAQQVSERAEISRTTLRKIEAGDGSVSFNSVAQVLRTIGKLDDVVDAVDPLRTDIGRLRAGKLQRRRAR